MEVIWFLLNTLDLYILNMGREYPISFFFNQHNKLISILKRDYSHMFKFYKNPKCFFFILIIFTPLIIIFFILYI